MSPIYVFAAGVAAGVVGRAAILAAIARLKVWLTARRAALAAKVQNIVK